MSFIITYKCEYCGQEYLNENPDLVVCDCGQEFCESCAETAICESCGCVVCFNCEVNGLCPSCYDNAPEKKIERLEAKLDIAIKALERIEIEGNYYTESIAYHALKEIE